MNIPLGAPEARFYTAWARNGHSMGYAKKSALTPKADITAAKRSAIGAAMRPIVGRALLRAGV